MVQLVIRFLLILFVLLLSIQIFSTPPVKVSFEEDCHAQNSIIFSRVLMQTFSKDAIKKILANDGNIVMGAKVDSLGYVIEIINIVSKNKLPLNFQRQVENALMRSKASFYICHPADMPEDEKERFLRVEAEEFQKNNCRIVSYITFPGNMLDSYREQAMSNHGKLTKYEYLKKQLQTY